MEIYLIRHTSPFIEKGICYGQADVELNMALFESEYERICAKIPSKPIVVYSSPLQRCLTLAQALSPAVANVPIVNTVSTLATVSTVTPVTNVPTLGTVSTVTTDKRLMELNFGDWELKNWADLPSAGLQVWMDDFVNEQVPGGESYTALYHRTVEFMEELQHQEQESVAIVTHAGNIRSVISWALDLPLGNSFRINLDYGAVVHIVIHKNKQLNQLKSLV